MILINQIFREYIDVLYDENTVSKYKFVINLETYFVNKTLDISPEDTNLPSSRKSVIIRDVCTVSKFKFVINIK